MGRPEGSPHSDGGKAGSMSSPSVKSEVCNTLYLITSYIIICTAHARPLSFIK